MPIDRWLFENLVCPRDDEPMELFGAQLKCANGHAYRIVDGIPILLRDDVDHVHWAAVRALELSEEILLSGAGDANTYEGNAMTASCRNEMNDNP